MSSGHSSSAVVRLRRRTLVKLAFSSAATLAAPGIAIAQSRYPSRPIRVINGFPAGGAIDVLFRAMSKNAEPLLGQPFVNESRPGAGGSLAIMQMKNAAPDGYTLGIVTMGVFRAPVMEDVGYDPLKDITYIANLSEVPFAIVVRADSPFRTWKDLLDYGKANPEKMNYGVAAGLGNSGHLLMEEITGHERVKWNVIPYKGGPDAQQALLGGHVLFAVDNAGGLGAFVDSGKFRVLAMATETRFPKWPDVPTTRELGYDAVVNSPWGLGGPAGIDPKIVQTLQDCFAKALASPEVTEALSRSGQSPRFMNHREFTSFAQRAAVEQRNLLTKYGFAKKR